MPITGGVWIAIAMQNNCSHRKGSTRSKPLEREVSSTSEMQHLCCTLARWHGIVFCHECLLAANSCGKALGDSEITSSRAVCLLGDCVFYYLFGCERLTSCVGDKGHRTEREPCKVSTATTAKHRKADTTKHHQCSGWLQEPEVGWHWCSILDCAFGRFPLYVPIRL